MWDLVRGVKWGMDREHSMGEWVPLWRYNSRSAEGHQQNARTQNELPRRLSPPRRGIQTRSGVTKDIFKTGAAKQPTCEVPVWQPSQRPQAQKRISRQAGVFVGEAGQTAESVRGPVGSTGEFESKDPEDEKEVGWNPCPNQPKQR